MTTISAEEKMYQEALSAIESDDKVRAKDLLSRLLRIDQKNPDYWLWMSAFVSSSKERRYCLNQVLQFDPQNKDARRGLILLGDLPLDPALSVPYSSQVRKWELPVIPGTEKETVRIPWVKMSLAVAGLLVAVTLIIFALRSNRLFIFQNRNVAVIGTAQPTPTYPATATFTATATLEISGPIAPWMLLEATYTPTPLYVITPHPIIEAYRIAMRNYQNGNWTQAIQYFAQAIDMNDQSPDLFYYLAESYRQSGNLNDALENFEQAIDLDEQFAPAYLGRARISAARNPDELENAVDDLIKAVEYDPNYGEAYLELAKVYIVGGNYDAAEERLVPAAGLLPDSAWVSLLQGKIALERGDPAAAVDFAQKANNQDLYLLDTYKFLGQALQADGQIKESLDPLYIFTQYSTEDDAQAMAWLADAYAANDYFDKAIEIFDQAIALNRFQIDAYLKRGRIYLSQADYEKALDDFSMAFKIRPTSYEACIQFGEAMLEAGQAGNAYQQISKCQKLAETDNELARMFFIRAISLERLENEIAQRDWERMLELPEEALDPAWVATAQAYLNTYYTATPTITLTPRPSVTMTATATNILEE
jgi:tetratricopeptide (TPR) repeat protein